MLEGFAAGVASVTTDVGCCREIIYGSDKDDTFGDAGIVVPVMDFEGMAESVITLAKDKKLRDKMAKAGRERVMKYYGYQLFIDSYKEIYNSYQ